MHWRPKEIRGKEEFNFRAGLCHTRKKSFYQFQSIFSGSEHSSHETRKTQFLSMFKSLSSMKSLVRFSLPDQAGPISNPVRKGRGRGIKMVCTDRQASSLSILALADMAMFASEHHHPVCGREWIESSSAPHLVCNCEPNKSDWSGISIAQRTTRLGLGICAICTGKTLGAQGHQGRKRISARTRSGVREDGDSH
jgi:hypothetical protein